MTLTDIYNTFEDIVVIGTFFGLLLACTYGQIIQYSNVTIKDITNSIKKTFYNSVLFGIFILPVFVFANFCVRHNIRF